MTHDHCNIMQFEKPVAFGMTGLTITSVAEATLRGRDESNGNRYFWLVTEGLSLILPPNTHNTVPTNQTSLSVDDDIETIPSYRSQRLHSQVWSA